DSEHRRPRGDALSHEHVKPACAQVLDPARERAHTGNHEDVRGAQLGLVGAHERARADVLERLLDRAPVAHAVIDDRDLHRLLDEARHAVSVPFVLGTPGSEGSIATASRRARANALNAASIMWCALLPASTRTCSVSFAAFAN